MWPKIVLRGCALVRRDGGLRERGGATKGECWFGGRGWRLGFVLSLTQESLMGLLKRSVSIILTLRFGRNERNQLCNGPEPRGWGDLLLWPETSLTKICIVSSSTEDVELMLETLDVRRIVPVVSVVCDLVGRLWFEDVEGFLEEREVVGFVDVRNHGW